MADLTAPAVLCLHSTHDVFFSTLSRRIRKGKTDIHEIPLKASECAPARADWLIPDRLLILALRGNETSAEVFATAWIKGVRGEGERLTLDFDDIEAIEPEAWTLEAPDVAVSPIALAFPE